MKEKGFTLAEVLITLGIIGVVAAMTIPTLMANIRGHQYRTKLKKGFSTLSQAAKMSQAQYGFDYAGITTKCGENGGAEHPEKVQSICSILNGTLTGATYYKNATDIVMKDNTSKGKKYKIIYGPFSNREPARKLEYFSAYILNDGTIIGFYKHMGQFNGCSLGIGNRIPDDAGPSTLLQDCVGFIDVNGTSLPNKEAKCSSGSNSLKKNDCIVKNNSNDLTDIYYFRFADGNILPASAAVRYVLNTAK